MPDRPIKVLIAKPGLDGHDRGAKVVAHAMRNAGFEVIYTGLHQTVLQIVQTALDEDVDVIGLSILSGAHIPITEKLMRRLDEEGAKDILVIVGGNIPKRDFDKLAEMGVKRVFQTGSRFEDIVEFIQNNAQVRA
ncbi:MAG: cobalamin B12-binding domain-containing protein [Thermoplasmata archaeon]|nr:MAG: cobalamin B12-binding domain-containing protein [Thermoplasmata archaeon]